MSLAFSGLGRPTGRGVRKCPKCGTINGTRGLSCKNRSCDMIFKEVTERKRCHLDSCRLITDSTLTAIFSIKLREKGPEQRGFVKFDLVSSTEHGVQEKLISSKGSCHVKGCSRFGLPPPATTSQSLLKSSIAVKACDVSCVHVAACHIRDGGKTTEAEALTVKHSVLNAMNISRGWKHKIWLRARKDGPLAQRVSKTTMVVKCEPDSLHELGYLHVTFNADTALSTFSCACEVVTLNSKAPVINHHLSNSSSAPRCIHFYSCLAVFLSDQKLSKEFAKFISDDQIASGFDQSESLLVAASEVAPMPSMGGAEGDELVSKELIDLDLPFQIRMETPEGEIQTISLPVIDGLADDAVVKALSELSAGIPDQPKRLRVEQPIEMLPDQLPQQILRENSISDFLGGGQPIVVESRNEFQMQKEPLISQEGTLIRNASQFNALEWLSMITESINQSMHYGSPISTQTLTFQAPHKFFDVLRERISKSGRQDASNSNPKKRLPNQTLVYCRKENPPFGTFTKYVWRLKTLREVKGTFDTNLVELQTSKCFVCQSDGTYVPIKTFKSGAHYKTYLKVGRLFKDRPDVALFTIEWTPSIFPSLNVGEVVLKFEFGRQCLHPSNAALTT